MEAIIWDYRYLIIVIIAAFIYCLFNWQQVKTEAYKGMLQAKSLAKDLVLNSGIEQENWVVDNIWPLLPISMRLILRKEVFRSIVQKLYKTAKDFIDDGKLNGTNGAAGEGTESVTIRQKFMSITNYRIKSPHGVIIPEFITIHNTANEVSAAAEIAYMSRMDTGNNVSFHYAVDDKEIVQGLPENRSAIHAGTTAGNKSSIAIEVCYSRSGGAKFIQAEKNAAWLTAKILHERGWGIEHIRTHKSWSGKDCPHLTLLMGWPRFLNMVSVELGKYSSKPINSYTEPVEDHKYRDTFRGNDAGWFEEQLHRIGYSWESLGCKDGKPDEIAASKVWDILDYEMDQSSKPRGAAGDDIRNYLKSVPTR